MIVSIFVAALLLGMIGGSYLLSRQYPPLGQALAFTSTMLHRASKTISDVLHKTASTCQQACSSSLAYPFGEKGQSTVWPGIIILSRLVYFMLSLSLLLGEAVSTLYALPALFQLPLKLHLPGGVELATGALFLCTPALAGAILLECVGLIRPEAGLFPLLGRWKRLLLGLPTFALLILSILVSGYFWLYRAEYLLSPDASRPMSVLLLGGLGLCMASVVVIALWGLTVGTSGVLSVLLWVGMLLCRIAAHLLSLIATLCASLCVHLGYRSPELPVVESHHFPALSAPVTYVDALPTSASTFIVEDIHDHQLEEPSMNLRSTQNTTVLAVGKSALLPFLIDKIYELGATSIIKSISEIDLSHVNTTVAFAGATQSPTPAQIQQALKDGKNDEQVYAQLLEEWSQRFVQDHLDYHHIPSPLLWLCDQKRLGTIPPHMISVKQRLPQVCQVVVTVLSEADRLKQSVEKDLCQLMTLHKDGVLASVLVIDPKSSMASVHGELVQLRLAATALVSALLTETQDRARHSFSSLFEELSDAGPFTTLNVASKPIALGKAPWRVSWVPGVKNNAGSGHLLDIVTQAKLCVDEVLGEPETSLCSYAQWQEGTPAVVLTAPVQQRDKRSPRLASDLSHYVATTYPYASVSTVSGNGAKYKQNGSKFFVQASCIAPIALPVPLESDPADVAVTSAPALVSLLRETAYADTVQNEVDIAAHDDPPVEQKSTDLPKQPTRKREKRAASPIQNGTYHD